MIKVKKINFKKIYAENFLCFGSEGIEIDFENYNNIVLIKGKNLDILDEDKNSSKISSNGVGKSSIPSVLVYGLFGKTVRKPNKISHKDVINNDSGKKLKVEVYWDDYKLQRTRKPDSLKLWKSSDGTWTETTEITLGGMPATQKLVEDIIGMSYETFTNIVVFTDDNTNSFLECDAQNKRDIVENLLSLEKYRSYYENAKKILKLHKDQLKNLEKDHGFIEKKLNDEKYNFEKLKKSKEEWSFTKKKAVLDLVATIKNLEKQKEEISNDDKETQAYNTALEDISTCEKNLVDLSESDSKLEKNKTVLDNAYEKLLESQNICAGKHIEEKAKVTSFKKDLSKIQSDINKIQNLENGVVCQHCLSTIDKSSHTHVLQSLIANKDEIIQKQTEAESSFAEVDRKLVSIKEKIGEISNKLVVLKTAQKKCNQEKELVTKKLNELKKIKKPEDNKKLQDIQNKIDVIKLQVKEKISELASPTPYDDLVQTSEHNINNFDQEINVQSDAIKSMHEKTKYFEFWITAFGDSGIRKYIIDEIMPALNSSINYWMQFLIDNKISLKFNNEFEETIEKFPIEKGNFNYECMSNGQRRRINLALSQAFAHVMSLNSGKTPSLIFLDEVTSNIDPQGVAGIYNMICEMAKEKQVFVTTHDYDLIDFLNGCDNLNLVMRNAKTKLEK